MVRASGYRNGGPEVRIRVVAKSNNFFSGINNTTSPSPALIMVVINWSGHRNSPKTGIQDGLGKSPKRNVSISKRISEK